MKFHSDSKIKVFDKDETFSLGYNSAVFYRTFWGFRIKLYRLVINLLTTTGFKGLPTRTLNVAILSK